MGVHTFEEAVTVLLTSIAVILTLKLIFFIILKDKKEIAALITNLLLLIVVTYFSFSQYAYIAEHYPGKGFIFWLWLVLLFIINILNVYLFIKNKKEK